jgi:opacity protein-like surface antigen
MWERRDKERVQYFHPHLQIGGSIMHTKSLAVALLGLGCLAAAWAPQSARAEITENIFELDTTNLLGTISFPSISGDSAAGVVLSYGSFTASDITSVSWTLDPDTDDVLAIGLNALQGDADCGFGSNSNCSNSTLGLSLSFATSGGTSCSSGGDGGLSECSAFDRETFIQYVPTAAVPEFSTWAMGCLGFAGLGFGGYRASRKNVAPV